MRLDSSYFLRVLNPYTKNIYTIKTSGLFTHIFNVNYLVDPIYYKQEFTKTIQLLPSKLLNRQFALMSINLYGLTFLIKFNAIYFFVKSVLLC